MREGCFAPAARARERRDDRLSPRPPQTPPRRHARRVTIPPTRHNIPRQLCLPRQSNHRPAFAGEGAIYTLDAILAPLIEEIGVLEGRFA